MDQPSVGRHLNTGLLDHHGAFACKIPPLTPGYANLYFFAASPGSISQRTLTNTVGVLYR